MKRARFSAAALPTWHFFLGSLALSLPAATSRRWLMHGGPHGLIGLGYHAVAAPCGSREKVWPPCSFLNKEPSKPTVWLPCSGHVQEQKRLPPRLANDSTRGLHGRHLLWGFMLRACLCGVRARVAAGSCNEANMTLRVVPACACAACVPMCSLHVPPVLPCSC